ncbi:unnamed protein product [Arabidopsis lyrata]|nr:unnamed protein product [Arabidopsis lyrata]
MDLKKLRFSRRCMNKLMHILICKDQNWISHVMLSILSNSGSTL